MSFVRKFGAFAGNAAKAGFGAYTGLGELANQTSDASNRTNLANSKIANDKSLPDALKQAVPIVQGWLKNMGVQGVETIDFGDNAPPAQPSFTGAAAGAAQPPAPAAGGASPYATAPGMEAALKSAPTPMVTSMAKPRRLGFTPQVMQEDY